MSEYIAKCNEVVGISGKPLIVPDYIDTSKEIVRCRDCKHYEKDPDPIDPGWPMMCADSGRDMLEPYGFCSWAERREQ